MASAKVIKKLREEATCAICLELMTEPVIIDCGHIYCRACIVALIEKKSSETSSLGTFLCPQCQEPFKSDGLQPNKQLENIIDTIKETNQERLCEEHGEKLQLFCEDDGQLICWCCERTAQHKGHVTALVEVAYQGYREKLQKAVTELKDTEELCTGLKVDTTQKISSWEEKVNQEKERIHTEFTALHTLLHQEEEFFMCRLEEEREQKLSRLQEDIGQLENTLQKLKNHILELDQKSQCSTHDLLQDVKGTLSRSSAINLETPDEVSLEIQAVCDVSELHLSAKKILKHSEGPRGSMCRALYQYVGKNMNELSFHKNNVIEILKEDPSGWWLGRLEGHFPAIYTEKI